MKNLRKIMMLMLVVVVVSVANTQVEASSIDLNKEIMDNYDKMTVSKYDELMSKVNKLDFEEKQILKIKLESVKKYRGLVDEKTSNTTGGQNADTNHKPINANIGYVNGKGNNLFKPNDPITRAEAAAMLRRISEDKLKKTPAKLKVNDYKNKWYTKDVQYTLDTGLLVGRGDSFKPNANVTRAEMATILRRLHGNDLPTKPVKLKVADYKGKWYTEDIQYCLDAGLLVGRGKGFEPNANVTRAEMVKAINTLIDKNLSIKFSNEYSDVDTSKWYYIDVMKASNILPKDIKAIKIKQ